MIWCHVIPFSQLFLLGLDWHLHLQVNIIFDIMNYTICLSMKQIAFNHSFSDSSTIPIVSGSINMVAASFALAAGIWWLICSTNHGNACFTLSGKILKWQAKCGIFWGLYLDIDGIGPSQGIDSLTMPISPHFYRIDKKRNHWYCTTASISCSAWMDLIIFRMFVHRQKIKKNLTVHIFHPLLSPTLFWILNHCFGCGKVQRGHAWPLLFDKKLLHETLVFPGIESLSPRSCACFFDSRKELMWLPVIS